MVGKTRRTRTVIALSKLRFLIKPSKCGGRDRRLITYGEEVPVDSSSGREACESSEAWPSRVLEHRLRDRRAYCDQCF